MHFCPQEAIMIINAFEFIRPSLNLIRHWCESCVNGTHKSCEDHAAGVEATGELDGSESV